MFTAEWVWPVLIIVGLIPVLAALELLSVVIAANWDTGESRKPSSAPKRAA